LNGRWVPHDTRDAIVDFVALWSEKTEIAANRFIHWLKLATSKFYGWKKRYGKANEHNGKIPRDHWLDPWEKDAIIRFHHQHPLEGYRRLTFMMLDQDIVAVSPASTWRVLHGAGLLGRWSRRASKKGSGFHQPSAPHHHWHIDISYINVSGTFYYLCSVLDGYSRFIAHWEIRESMTEAEVEIILQRAREAFPNVTPRIISDNGPQFIAKDFKEFIRIAGMTHARISPGYPQSNGKLERWHQSLKQECIRPQTPLSLDDARRLVAGYVEHYNTVRLHSSLGYVTPKDTLEGKEEQIFQARDQKLEAAREQRRLRREALRPQSASIDPVPTPIEAPPAPTPVSNADPPVVEPGAAADRALDASLDASPNAQPTAPRRVENLHALRNHFEITALFSQLGIPTHHRGARISFRCPTCGEYHTATNPRTNLARCFRCMRNFNPIELVMAERNSTFLQAVSYLETRLHTAP